MKARGDLGKELGLDREEDPRGVRGLGEGQRAAAEIFEGPGSRGVGIDEADASRGEDAGVEGGAEDGAAHGAESDDGDFQ